MIQRLGPSPTLNAALVVVMLVTVTFFGCAIVDNEEPSVDEVNVRTTGTHVLLSNGLESTVYYFMVGRQLSVLIDWIPHLDDDQSVAAGRSVAIPYEDIMMNSDTGETEVIVYWWQATMRDGKRVPGDITSVIADL